MTTGPSSAPGSNPNDLTFDNVIVDLNARDKDSTMTLTEASQVTGIAVEDYKKVVEKITGDSNIDPDVASIKVQGIMNIVKKRKNIYPIADPGAKTMTLNVTHIPSPPPVDQQAEWKLREAISGGVYGIHPFDVQFIAKDKQFQKRYVVDHHIIDVLKDAYQEVFAIELDNAELIRKTKAPVELDSNTCFLFDGAEGVVSNVCYISVEDAKKIAEREGGDVSLLETYTYERKDMNTKTDKEMPCVQLTKLAALIRQTQKQKIESTRNKTRAIIFSVITSVLISGAAAAGTVYTFMNGKKEGETPALAEGQDIAYNGDVAIISSGLWNHLGKHVDQSAQAKRGAEKEAIRQKMEKATEEELKKLSKELEELQKQETKELLAWLRSTTPDKKEKEQMKEEGENTSVAADSHNSIRQPYVGPYREGYKFPEEDDLIRRLQATGAVASQPTQPSAETAAFEPSTLASLNKKIQDLKAEKSQLQTEKTQLNEKYKILEKQLEEVNTKASQLSGEREDLLKEKATLEAQIKGLMEKKQRTAELPGEGDEDDLESEEITKLNASICEKDGKIASLNKKIEELKKKTEGLESIMAENNNKEGENTKKLTELVKKLIKAGVCDEKTGKLDDYAFDKLADYAEVIAALTKEGATWDAESDTLTLPAVAAKPEVPASKPPEKPAEEAKKAEEPAPETPKEPTDAEKKQKAAQEAIAKVSTPALNDDISADNYTEAENHTKALASALKMSFEDFKKLQEKALEEPGAKNGFIATPKQIIAANVRAAEKVISEIK